MNFMRKNKRYRWAIQGMGLLILLWGILVDLPKAIPEDILWEAANSAGMEAYQQGRY
jgi:hypothetical protein